MKHSACALVAILLTFTGYSQKAPLKFGSVPIESLTMTTYDKDSTAAAAILCDYGVSTIRYSQQTGFSLQFERTTRIKIFTKEGFEWGNFEIPLYSDGSSDEKVTGLKASTFNLENGKIVESKAKSESIFKEQASENWKITKVAFPNVKEGSVLDITYSVSSEFLTHFQDWQFQYTVPVAWSEYRANIPEWFHYDRYMQGYIALTANEHERANTFVTLNYSEHGGLGSGTTFSNEKVDFVEDRYRWVAESVPAFKSEPFITTYKDYLSKINFELAYTKMPGAPMKTYMGSWEDINQQHVDSENFMGEIRGNAFLKRTVEELTAGLTKEEEKIAAITAYVKANVAWDGTSSKYISSSFKKVLETKKGSSAEINLLLACMLDKANVTVHPVIISTRDHGFVREASPISTQFNYVLCMAVVGEKQILLDATDGLLPATALPERCLNGNGFAIKKEGYGWVPLRAAGKSRTSVSANVKINADGTLEGKVGIDRHGYHAQLMRKKYFAKGEEEYVKDFIGSKVWQVAKSEIKNTKEVTEPLKETYEVSIEQHADVSGDHIYLNPFLMLREEENPFKITERKYPVDYGSAHEKIYMCAFTIPEGYSIDEMPQGKVYTLPENAAKFTFNVGKNGNQIMITSMLQINRSIFSQEEYPSLREFYNMIVAKQAEQIVLKKL